MQGCKQYKPVQQYPVVFHANTGGACTDCVYFSQKNCGQRDAAAIDMSAEQTNSGDSLQYGSLF